MWREDLSFETPAAGGAGHPVNRRTLLLGAAGALSAAALPWPAPEGDTGRRLARIAGAHVVLSEGEPVLYLERGGRALQTLVDREDSRLGHALGALVEEVRERRIRRMALEQVDGVPAMASALAPLLIALGFQEGPRRLTLSA